MTHAIIIVGNERRFMGAARPFAAYLRTKARCGRVTVITGAYKTPDELGAAVRSALGRASDDEPVLVAYFGHGVDGAWSFALEHQEKPLRLPYEKLAETLARHDGPLVVLNDCCHAASLVPHLEKAGIDPHRCLLISACGAKEITIPGTAKEVETQWIEGKVFEPVMEREQICKIDMTPYEPPMHVRAGRAWKNARIRLGNMFRPKRVRRPTYIFVNSPPNGWAKHEESVTVRAFGLRWGATLDYLFFPKPL